ncbi:MAG TPA: DsbA family oxidoreductase [Candidatus Nanopelagicaceae bacterium]|nr:DsbA family oxidoreductase [Candidatus Nanopelagicaceae bacterium]
MLIETWADVICPWCYIGKRNLQAALLVFETNDSITVSHRAFRLDPMATGSRSALEMLGERFGLTQARTMMEQVSAVAAGVGLAFRLEDTLTGSTLDAHRILLWAQAQGEAQQLLEVFQHAYFEQAQSLFDHENLIDLAFVAGFSRDEVRSLLEGEAFVSEVESDQAMAASLGATGVPFFVIDGKYGISGAQPPEMILKTLAQANS